MNDMLLYYCKICGNRQKFENQTDVIHLCHNEPMEPFHQLPECETTMTAEHARSVNFGEPCDDNRGGVIEQK